MYGRNRDRRGLWRGVQSGGGDSAFDLLLFARFEGEVGLRKGKEFLQFCAQDAFQGRKPAPLNEVQGKRGCFGLKQFAPNLVVIAYFEAKGESSKGQGRDLNQKAARSGLRQMGIGGTNSRPITFPAPLVSTGSAAVRLHDGAEAVDRFACAMEKPAGERETVRENTRLRQDVEMEEIIARGIAFRGRRDGPGISFHDWVHGFVRRGGKASVKSAEARERLGL